MLDSEMNFGCEDYLIGLQTTPDSDYEFMFVYQDHFTKLVYLLALQTRRIENRMPSVG